MFTSNDKLDAVLRALNQAHENYFRNYSDTESIRYAEKRDYLSPSEIGRSIPNMDEVDLITEYLCDVKHMIARRELSNGVKSYRILWEGKVFIEDSGFVKSYEMAQSQKRIQILKENLLIAGSLVAAVGAMILAYFEFLKKNNRFEVFVMSTIAVVFFLGVFVGGILWHTLPHSSKSGKCKKATP